MMLLDCVVSFLMLGAAPLVLAQKPYAITGVAVDSRAEGMPLRKDINELQAQGGAQWDLYIRALAAFYDSDASDNLSYFQVSGIHGKPFVEWNNTGDGTSSGWRGYCPHNERLFLSWHRPYVLLFEQVLVGHAKRIAQEYPQRYRYQYVKAAETLRAPYWDWAAETGVPQATVPETVTINMPDGEVLKQKNIANPLYTFKFPKKALNGAFGPFDSQRRTRTYRCPAPNSYPTTANANLDGRPYKKWIYDAFTTARDFSEFASTGDGGISLEQIHNGIHWDGGCGGQFLAAEFSAFDPLFWMHHCNVDRLWAYWEAMHPDDAIFEDSYSGGSRFATPEGTTITPDSPLKPFSQASGDFHTTRSVRTIQGFGYSYQELEYWQKSEEQMRQDAKRLINRLYSDAEAHTQKLMRREEQTTRYFVNVELDVTEVERPCQVVVYVGGAKAGSLVVMAQPAKGIIHGAFALDDAIAKSGVYGKGTDSTVDSLEASLGLEILKGDGSSISIDSVPSLKVEIEDVDVTPASADDEFPTYGPSRRRPTKATARVDLNLDLDLSVSINL